MFWREVGRGLDFSELYILNADGTYSNIPENFQNNSKLRKFKLALSE